eukprot:scaffold34383_cov18-Tisochrysis_lutea.AAC.1
MHACMRACAICISGICGTLLRRSGSSHLNLFSEVNPNSCICETSPATSVCGPQVGIVSSMTGELTDWDKTVRVNFIASRGPPNSSVYKPLPVDKAAKQQGTK